MTLLVDKFRREDWEVRNLDLATARSFAERYHYAKGGSNTAVYVHGLFNRTFGYLGGLAWWLPPTRVAAESVNRENWQKVLSLSRMVIVPCMPKNAASFLLSQSVKMIRRDRRFISLVTYADESQGHTGHVYRAANWVYVGRTGPYPRWVDASGKQTATQATKTRTKAQMLALGCLQTGSFYKHKFVLHVT